MCLKYQNYFKFINGGFFRNLKIASCEFNKLNVQHSWILVYLKFRMCLLKSEKFGEKLQKEHWLLYSVVDSNCRRFVVNSIIYFG